MPVAKESNKALAEKYGVHLATIYQIKNGKTWRHINQLDNSSAI